MIEFSLQLPRSLDTVRTWEKDSEITKILVKMYFFNLVCFPFHTDRKVDFWGLADTNQSIAMESSSTEMQANARLLQLTLSL